MVLQRINISSTIWKIIFYYNKYIFIHIYSIPYVLQQVNICSVSIKKFAHLTHHWSNENAVCIYSKKDAAHDRLCDQHCVLASGCLVSMIKFFALIILSCLHLGQNRGKVTNSVSHSICKRVLAPHHGHKTQRFSSSLSFMLFSPSFCNQPRPWQ